MKKKLLLFLLFAPITTVLAQITTVNARFITSVGCEIGVDDEMSSNNVFEKELLSGTHIVIIKYNGEVVKREEIEVPDVGSFTKEIPITGKVFVSSPIKDVTVFVDGTEKGKAPITLELLGNHDITLRYINKKYKPYSENITVQPFDEIERDCQLKVNNRPWKYNWFFLPQVALPTKRIKDAKFGLMFGTVKTIGFYVKGIYGCYAKETTEKGWFTGETATNYWAAAGGLMVNVIKPLYLYSGVGYGERETGYELLGNKYYFEYEDDDYPIYDVSNILYDFGAMFSFGHFALNIGASKIEKEWILNCGVGVKF